MPCCSCSKSPPIEQGVISGNKNSIPGSLEGKQLITIFEDRLKSKKIDERRIAVQFTERISLTYKQLNAFGSCLAKSIIERLGYDYKIENPDKDLLIAVCLPMSDKAIALILGILKTGAAYLPLDSQYPEKLLIEVLSAFKPVMLISDDNGKIFNKYDAEKFSSICKICSIEELWVDLEFALEPRTRRASMEISWDIDFLENKDNPVPLGERPVAVYYAGGLCNNPIGVRINTKAILNLVSFHWTKVGKYTKRDACCVTVPLSNATSIPQLFIPLLCGACIHLFRRTDVSDTDNFVKNVAWRNITKLSVPTHLLYSILESILFLPRKVCKKALKNLKIFVCYGAFVQHDTAQLFFSMFKRVTLVNSIGSVETAGEVAVEAFTTLKDYERKLVDGVPTLGNLVDNLKLYIVDENMKLVPDGTVGEICISGSCLPLGFVTVKANEETANKEKINTTIIENPFSTETVYSRFYKTGEHGYICDSTKGRGKKLRRIFLTGRNDAFVKFRGNIFSTNRVNDIIKLYDGILDAHSFMLHAGRRDQTLYAFIVLGKGTTEESALIADLLYTLKTDLPEWAIPTEVRVFHDCLPDCANPKSLCPECCRKIAYKEHEEKLMESIKSARPMVAEPSNQYG